MPEEHPGAKAGPPSSSLGQSAVFLAEHNHACLICHTAEEQLIAVVPFIRQGLERGERCLCIADNGTAEALVEALRRCGIDVNKMLNSSALIIDREYNPGSRNGQFNSGVMIDFLHRALKDAKAAGYPVLRVTGEPPCNFSKGASVAELMEYEDKLNRFLPEEALIAICQYNYNHFGPEIIRDVIRRHPLLISDGWVGRNFYYIPPGDLLQGGEAKREVEHLLESIRSREMAEEALKKSEARYRALFEYAEDYIFVLEGAPAGEPIIRDANEAALVAHGFSREELIGKPISFLDSSSDMIDHRLKVKDMLAANGEAVFEINRRRKDGTSFIVEVSAKHWLDGNKDYYFSIERDVTERKRAEEKLIESNRLTEQIMDSAQEGIVVHGPDLRYLKWNRFMETLTGFKADEVLGKHPLEVSPVLERSGIMESIKSALKGKTLPPVFLQYDIPQLGKTGWTSNVNVPLRNASGEIVGAIGIVTEITERKKSEEILRESEALFRSQFEFGNIGIALLSPEKSWIRVNRRLCEMFGYSKAELLQKSWAELAHPEDLSDDSVQFDRVIAGKIDTYEVDKCFLRKDGAVVFMRLTVSCFRNLDGSVRFFINSLLDITESKRLEAQFREVQKMEAIGQLAGGVAHDFNNILTAIMIRLSLFQDNSDIGKELRDELGEMENDLRRAATLTQQLLMFGRRSVLKVKVLDLNEVVENLLKLLRRLIGENITLKWLPGVDLPRVEVDAGMIEQVVMNLAINARDAKPNGGPLAICTQVVEIKEDQVKPGPGKYSGQFIRLSVADSGCGMDEKTKSRIFEPFFTTKEPGKGTGLGLATVHGIVGQHKGWIEVESRADKGATFHIFLPATTKALIATKEKGKAAEPIYLGHETILLVEDEPAVLRMASHCLRKFGYQVLEAHDSYEALAQWKNHRQEIDLLFTDMILPEGMMGLDLAKQLRESKPDLKVIVSSGYSAEMVQSGIPAGAGFVYLPKPYQISALAETVRECFKT